MIEIGTINFPPEEIEYYNKEMKLRINSAEYERGELIITKKEIAWKKENSDSQGFSIPWEKIVVQAISSENTRSIYFHIDSPWPNNPNEVGANNEASSNGNHHENEDDVNGHNNEEDEFIDCDDEVSEITEFWIVPDDLDEVDNIYYAMKRYPQNENMEESDEDEDDFLDGEDMEQMNINDERFADD